ncbi:MAG: T9SS type A sorting domain-containing protein [Bacteroidales bacterium]|nr:T9SS type A sorting domain-containing protein [Bacteroidales bacterium]
MRSTDYNFHAVRPVFENYIQTNNTDLRIPGRKQFDRISWFLDSRVDSNGRLGDPGATWRVYQDYLRDKSNARIAQVADWQMLGPFITPNQGIGMGRINCIAFHPTQYNIFYAGSASGGIWRSTDYGGYWQPMSDQLASLGISHIVIDHQNPDVIYAATGDNDGADTYSIGVIKSVDGGMSWNTTGLSWDVINQRKIGKIIMHPANNQILYATSSVGIYKTTDGAVSWTKIRSGASEDITFKPDNPDVLYVTIGNRLFVTTNAGSTFLIKNVNFNATVNRIKIAVTPADPNYVYIAAARSSDSGFEGLYRSTDAGNSFTCMSSSPNIYGYSEIGAGQGGITWFAMALVASPVDKNVIFTGSVNLWRSNNGGATWSCVGHWTGAGNKPYVHADVHQLTYNPNNGYLYACHDGGVDVTTNSGNFWTRKSEGLAVGQVYRIGLSQQDYRRIIGGWQDNGTHFFNNPDFTFVHGGDGMEAIISHSNYNYMYSASQYGEIRRSVDAGATWYDIKPAAAQEGHWVTPYVMHPTDHKILFAGYNEIFKSTNYGNTWNKLTNFNTTGYYDKFRALAIAQSNPNYLYAATYNTIYRTLNGGSSWVNCNNNLPAYPISYIAVHPQNPSTLFVTLSGYYNGDKVYMSTNAGNTWVNISGSLPNIPTNCIVAEKGSNGGLYVGMDVGVYYRDSSMTDWIPFMDNLPNVIVNELEIHYPNHKVVAATYGRGIWQSETYQWINSVNDNPSPANKGFNIYPNPAQDAFVIDMIDNTEKVNSIMLFDIRGQQVDHFVPAGQRELIHYNSSLMPAGLYFVKISTEHHEYTGKIIIR